MDRTQIKSLLNNLTLLKWVKKFTCDNLLEDNKMADKFSVKAGKDSISIMDASATKLLVTNAEYEGKELVRFSLKQLNELLEVVGKEGEVIIPEKSQMNEMIAKIGTNIAVICPLVTKDKPKKEKENGNSNDNKRGQSNEN